MLTFLRNMLAGAVIGVADVIPGVSGGTMAVILDIYDELIEALNHFFKNWKKHLLFLAPVLLGAGIGILLFGNLIKHLLSAYPMLVNFFFLGLILGSIPMIARHSLSGGFRPLHLIPFALFAALMIVIAFLPSSGSTQVITALNAGNFFLLLVTSFIAAICMIIPGISGSMMLMIFGVYYSVITAVTDLNIPVLIPVGLGVVLGILFGAKGIGYCLERFPQVTYWSILGLVAGSLLSVFRGAGFTFSLEGLFSILLLAVGAALSFLMSSDSWKDRFTRKKTSGGPDAQESDS